MTDAADDLRHRLSRIDPVRHDAPPAVGSPRFNASKEHAMSNHVETDQTSTIAHLGSNPARSSTVDRGPRRGRLAAAAAAALIAVLSVSFLLAGLTAASAADKVQAAASNSAAVDSLRIDIETNSTTLFPGGEATIELSGQNVRLSATGMEWLVIDGQAWMVIDGEAIPMDETTDTIVPYSEASARVIEAALQSGGVSDQGTERIRETETTRYVVELDDTARDALRAVPGEHQTWFVEETQEEVLIDGDGATTARRGGFLEDADTLTIWVADELIHRISVNGPAQQFTHTYYDFNAPIEITAPTR